MIWYLIWNFYKSINALSPAVTAGLSHAYPPAQGKHKYESRGRR